MNRSLLILAIAFPACAPVTSEPPNLSDLKAEVAAYADSEAYQRDLASSASSARSFLKHRAASGQPNLAVVFDIDETVLSNLPHMKSADWGYHPQRWEQWVAEADAPGIAPIREVYGTAVSLGYRVIFLSGRTELTRSATVLNLRRQGMGKYDRLILRPASKAKLPTEPAVDFKTRVRKELTAQGYVIVANFGDQLSDLEGGYSERTYKLPNPFYRIP